MSIKQVFAVLLLLLASAGARGQQSNQVQLKIDSSNRTLTVGAEARISVDPEVAVLHLGFETPPSDAKQAYALGAKISNDVVAALKQAGIPETSIRSEWQRLNNANGKPHKFTLAQQWTVETPPERAAEILDVAVTAGATDSGQIDWTVHDEHALEEQAIDRAAARVKSDAAVLAKGMGVHLGSLIYVTNQVSTPQFMTNSFDNNAAFERSRLAPMQALSIEPRKVVRTANVHAVFAIE